jgi:glycine/D-amino acid oxidase-like deaminating enzyme
VVIATNGYTGLVTPWHRRRLVTVASAMIATEEIGVERVRAVLPQMRVYGDTKRMTSYYRPSPDGTRILFGGRARFVGHRDGVHHALACSGSGLVILTHLGRAIAREISGNGGPGSAFANLPFPSHPLYTGHAWFMPFIATWYGMKDTWEMRP